MSTKSKFTIIMVLLSLIGAIVFGLLSFLESRQSLRDAAFNELTALRTTRVAQLEEYFQSVADEALVITENPLVSDAVSAFKTEFKAINQTPELNTDDLRPRLQAYYESDILPGFSTLLKNGEASFAGFRPKSKAAKALQLQYLAGQPQDVASGYAAAHKKYHHELRFIRDQFAYYDIFLIDHETGEIVYTVQKEADFGTTVFDGPYRGTGLSKAVLEVLENPAQSAVAITDSEFYLPSSNLPAIFVASTIYEDGELIGILAIQLTLTDLNNIMISDGRWKEVGLKNSGETYLVGEDYLIRNESRFFMEDLENYLVQLRALDVPEDELEDMLRAKSSIMRQYTRTEGVEAALRGKSDTRVILDYRGVGVLSAYAPLRIDDRTYAVMAEIDAEEAFKPVTQLLSRTAITTAIVIPLSAIAAIWLSSMLMAPSRSMVGTAKAFLSGSEDERFDEGRKGEFGNLATAMNTVLETAQKRREESETSQANVTEIIERLMPSAIAERYAAGEREIVSHEPSASAAMLLLSTCDNFEDFDNPGRSRDLYEKLDDMLDELAARDGVDVINQAGMGYLAFCGLTTNLKNHAERLYRFCGHAARAIDAFNTENGTEIELRIGLHSGAMFGALIGNYSMAYEIWGEAASVAKEIVAQTPAWATAISDIAAEQIASDDAAKSIKLQGIDDRPIKCRLIADARAMASDMSS